MKKLYFDNEGAAIDLDQAVALAEKQVFIKNVKPLVSNENYIAAIPVVQGITEDVIAPIIKSNVNSNKITYTHPEQAIAQTTKPATSIASSTTTTKVAQVKPAVAPKTESAQPVQAITKVASVQPQQKSQPQVVQPKAQPTVAYTPVISAGIGTVKAPSAPDITTTAVKSVPTTNIYLAERYYIRGLQKCVLRDLQGAVADLNKAIENNSNYADAYYYRAAIRKELGDSEGFKKDYSKAIQINPSLQAFNDSNCLSLING